jgi:hypothetical protein
MGIDTSAPFFQEMEESHSTGKDMMSVNGKNMPRSIWNLILTKRDLFLYTKGMRINRHWKVSSVKKYFGIKGSGQTLYDNFMVIYSKILGESN